MRVFIPHLFSAEIKYTVDVLLHTIIGASINEYSYDYHSDQSVKIEDDSGKILSIELIGLINGFNYDCAQIPIASSEVVIDLGDKTFKLLSIYGDGKIKLCDKNHLKLGIDIISSAYFMLSRWEEMVLNYRDNHGRFDAKHALAIKLGFIKRPIVNEYASFIAEYFEIPIKSNFKPIITFDIDYIYQWKSVRSLLGAIKNSPTKAIEYCFSYLRSKIDKKYDPFYSFDYILAQIEYKKVNTVFYFKTNEVNVGSERTDYQIDEITEIVSKILTSSKNEIGLHTSYATKDQPELMLYEKEKLERGVKKEIEKVRQDFLRLEFPKTIKFQQEAGFKEDSSMAYTHFPGFRCGICRPFPVFDISSNTKLDIMEAPLLGMMSIGLDITLDSLLYQFSCIISEVRKHKGDAIFLWHNSDLDSKEKREAFEKLLELMTE